MSAATASTTNRGSSWRLSAAPTAPLRVASDTGPARGERQARRSADTRPRAKRPSPGSRRAEKRCLARQHRGNHTVRLRRHDRVSCFTQPTTPVILSNATLNPDGTVQLPSNIRYTEFGSLTDARIDSVRQQTDFGMLTGAQRNQFLIDQLIAERDGRVSIGNVTWVSIARGVNKVGPTVGLVASGVCLIGGPTNPVGATGCGVALAADAAVAFVNGAAALTCETEGCGVAHATTGAFAVTGAVVGAPGTEARRAAAFFWDGFTTAGSYQDQLSDHG